MKKTFFNIIIALGLLVSPGLLLVGQAAAVPVFQGCSAADSKASVCKDEQSQGSSNVNPVITVIKVVIQILAVLIGVTAVIIIIVSGLRMVTASGDAQAVANARNGIIYALVGLVIALVAQSFVAFVLNKIQ